MSLGSTARSDVWSIGGPPMPVPIPSMIVAVRMSGRYRLVGMRPTRGSNPAALSTMPAAISHRGAIPFPSRGASTAAARAKGVCSRPAATGPGGS